MTIAVVGSINMDVTAYMYRLPKPGETLHGKEYIVGLGGKGANQAVAARKLGSEVAFIGRIGADDFGKGAERALTSYGLDMSLIRKDHDGATGIAIINVGEGGENYISVIAGSNFRVDLADVERGRAALEQSRVLLLQLEVPLEASLAAAAIVRTRGGTVILDPAPAKDLDPSVLNAVDIITPNESEAGLLLGWQPQSPEEGLKAAKELRTRAKASRRFCPPSRSIQSTRWPQVTASTAASPMRSNRARASRWRCSMRRPAVRFRRRRRAPLRPPRRATRSRLSCPASSLPRGRSAVTAHT